MSSPSAAAEPAAAVEAASSAVSIANLSADPPAAEVGSSSAVGSPNDEPLQPCSQIEAVLAALWSAKWDREEFVVTYDRIFRLLTGPAAGEHTMWLRRTCPKLIQSALTRVWKPFSLGPPSSRLLAVIYICIEFCRLLNLFSMVCMYLDRRAQFDNQPQASVRQLGQSEFASVMGPALSALSSELQSFSIADSDSVSSRRKQWNQLMRDAALILTSMEPPDIRCQKLMRTLGDSVNRFGSPIVLFSSTEAEIGGNLLGEALQQYMYAQPSIVAPEGHTIRSQVTVIFTNCVEVGSGSYGKVLQGLREQELKVYAIKQIAVADQLDLRELTREVVLLASLKHEHVVGYHTFWHDEASKSLYLQMEFCESTLQKGVKQLWQSRSESERSKQLWLWFIQLTDALAYIHATQIRHGDLKAKNVLLDRAVSQAGGLRIGQARGAERGESP